MQLVFPASNHKLIEWILYTKFHEDTFKASKALCFMFEKDDY